MERLDFPHPRRAGDFAGGLGREVRTIARLSGVLGRETGFDEEGVGLVRERCDRRPVCRRVGNVGDIGDLLAASDGHDVAERAEGCGAAAGKRDRTVIWHSFEHCALQRPEPLPGRQAKLLQTVFPDIRMRLLREGEAQARP